MERLFPASMAAVPNDQLVAKQTDQIANRVVELLYANAGGGQPEQPEQAPPAAMAESDDLTPLATYRVRRLLREARKALDEGQPDAAVGG
jgi:hypothetical protein